MSLKVNLWRKEYMEYVALKDVCKINMGQSPDSSSYNDKKEGIPFYQGNADFGEKHPIPRVWCNAPTKIAQPKDILMSVRAPIGALNYAQEKCCIGRGLAAITPDKDKLSLEFLYWFLRGKNSELNSKGTGSTFKAISKKTLEEIRVPLIDLEKQQKMAQALEKTYSVIQMRTKQLKELDDLIKARFVEMFEDKEKAWPVVTIADICKDSRTGPFGSALHHDEFVNEGIFVLGIDNAVENKFSYNRMRYITEDKYQQLKRYTVYPGDVIITIMGTVGRSAVIPKDMPKAINTKHLACLTPDAGVVDSYFLCNAFQIHPDIKQQLRGQTKGAIMDGLNLTIIKGLKFRLPPLELQKQFSDFVNQIDKSKVTVQKALDETQLLFDSLMQQYFG